MSTISAMMMTLDITIVLVALPAISEDLKLTLSGGQWVINAYSLAFASLMLSVGSISDLIGRRTIFLIGHVLFLAASVGCLLADSQTLLVASRAVQGAGGALVFGTSVPLLSDAFSPAEKKERTRAIAILMGLSAAASAIGPLIGGALVENGAWEWIFAINIPIGLFVIVTTMLFIPDLHKQARLAGKRDMPPVDIPTTILAAGMLFALNYAIISGPERGWTHWVVVVSFAVSLQLGVIMAWIQTVKGDSAMIDIRLFKIPSFSTVSFSAFAARLFSFGMMPFLVLWLAGQAGLSALQIGYVSMALALPIVLFSGVGLVMGKFMRLGWVQAVGMLIVGAGLLLGLLVHWDSDWPDLIPSYVVIGIGTGIMLPHLMDLSVSVVPPEKTGTASGIANTSMPLGTSFGVALYGAYLSNHIGDKFDGVPQQLIDATEAARFDLIDMYAPQYGELARTTFVEGLHGIFIMAAIFATIGALACALFIREKDIRTAEQDMGVSRPRSGQAPSPRRGEAGRARRAPQQRTRIPGKPGTPAAPGAAPRPRPQHHPEQRRGLPRQQFPGRAAGAPGLPGGPSAQPQRYRRAVPQGRREALPPAQDWRR
ncbi:MFS transporter [Corynebacterium uberis]|uniref:MFS transporter n=1 Tax=Corynebacterium TaxID=1716 RepID=UPI001D0BC901|nr:MFS transporter [Corynebacterium uberis]MCZ9309900.1 MFS transporter [Corynebacterium sp. c6VSa_13]UDL73179.1 MFS transporter [Corynebacterium uberis]UDL78156.1 MFS transporter [Corynebacterium uberis]UDL82574.1 MFS transporter [Corynebacterium uberis]UDL84781.1 MFS transporter [Corynebacterium uberis]